MAIRAVFAYNNLDDTADLNAHFKALVSRGVISGGSIVPVSSSSNVTVNPFYAASFDGMVIYNDAAITVACAPGQVNYVVLRAVYNSPAAPTLSMESMSAANYNADPQKNYLILFGTVDLTTSSSVSLASISYVLRDRTDKLGHSRILGAYGTIAERDAAWPSTAPVAQQPNDFVLVTAASSGQPAFYFWNGVAWVTFGSYEQLSSDFAAHTSGVVGGGTTVHVTSNVQAALAGTGGIPGPTNRFVTESDTSRVISTDEKASLDNAVGGPLTGTNPAVADGLPVVVTRLVAYTPTVAQDYVTITRSTNGIGLINFGAAVYVGKLGIDTVNNTSSSRRCFKVEDAFFNGYSDSDGPLYVLDIQTADGASSYNPSTDANVSPIGYWDPANPATAIRIKFNRVLAVGHTIYIKFNAKGSVSTLAPGGAYLPASTGFSAGREAYQEAFVQVINSQTVGTSNVTQLNLADGTSDTPSLAFTSDAGTGLFHIPSIIKSGYSTYSALGIACNTETVALFSRSSSVPDTSLAPLKSPLVFEQVYDGSNIGYRIYQFNNLDNNLTNTGIDLGYSHYVNGFSSSLNVSLSSLTAHVPTIFEQTVTLSDGSENSPGMRFTSGNSGFYYLGSQTFGLTTFYNTIGISLNKRTAYAFASNTATNTLTSGLQSALVFEQSVLWNKVTYRRSINVYNDTSHEAVHSFGESSYMSDYVPWMEISSSGVAILTSQAELSADRISVGGSLGAPTAMFTYAGSSGFMITAGYSTALIGSNGSMFTVYMPTSINGTLNVSSNGTFNGTLLTALGSETAPSYSFNGRSNTGFYYAGNVVTTGQSVRSAIGISIEGMSAVLFSRNAAPPSGLDVNDVPLVFEQFIDPADQTVVQHRIIGFNRTSVAPNSPTISIGFGDYVSDFDSVLDITRNGVRFNYAPVFTTGVSVSTLHLTGALTSTSTAGFSGTVTAANFMDSTASTSSAVSYAILNAGTGLYGTSTTIGLALNGTGFMAFSSSTNKLTIAPPVIDLNAPAINVSASSTMTVAGSLIVTGSFSAPDPITFGTVNATNVNIAGTLNVTSLAPTNLTVTNFVAANVNIAGSGSIDTNAVSADWMTARNRIAMNALSSTTAPTVLTDANGPINGSISFLHVTVPCTGAAAPHYNAATIGNKRLAPAASCPGAIVLVRLDTECVLVPAVGEQIYAGTNGSGMADGYGAYANTGRAYDFVHNNGSMSTYGDPLHYYFWLYCDGTQWNVITA